MKEHLQHLEVTMRVIQEHYLFVKMLKCKFACGEIDYLGHLISAQRVWADPSKLQVMLEWPLPKSLKALKGFLDLMGYYQKFIKGYGMLATPQPTKKKGFH